MRVAKRAHSGYQDQGKEKSLQFAHRALRCSLGNPEQFAQKKIEI